MADETLSCASCGRATAPGATFCSGCGTAISGAPGAVTQTMVASGDSLTNCPSCGGRMHPADQFCESCGEVRPMSGSASGGRSSVWDAILARVTRATQGEFEVIGEIGRGAMGAVYLANDTELGRKVAIKVIAPQLLADDNMVERFRLEARTVASLRHPHIVAIHAVRSRDDLHYFVMAFVEGCSLRDIVKTHGPLPIPIIQALLFQVGGALAYAHRAGGGVIHRDVKPANIMIDVEGNAFLTDFGISKVAESTGLTQTGLIIGTPEYMSPEQCMGEPPTGAGDQYSLGIVAYEMLCGEAPFTGTQYSVLLAHGSRDPEPIEKLRPDCPLEVREAVMRMLAKKPADRWPTLDDAVVGLGGKPLGHSDPLRAEIVALIPEIVEPEAAPDVSSPPSPAPGTPSIASEAPTVVYIAKLPEWLEPGESYDLRAHAETAGGSELPESDIEWSSSDPSVAKVENGRVIALSPGVVSIVATADGVETSLNLRVSVPGPAEIVVEPSVVQIEPGRKVALKAVARDRRGKPMKCDLVWSCTGAEVATVSKNGEVNAHSFGVATVTAAAGDVQTTVSITVKAAPAAPIYKVTQAIAQQAARPRRWLLPVAVAVSVFVLMAIAWALRGGLSLGPLSEQSAEPPAVLDGPDLGSAALSVAAVTVTMDPPRDVIRPGDTVRLVSSAVNAKGDPVSVGPVIWSVDDTVVASVDTQGLVVAGEVGRTIVYAAVGGLRGFVEISVSAPPEPVTAGPTRTADAQPERTPPAPAVSRPVPASISVILETPVMREEATQEIELRIVDAGGRRINDLEGVSTRSTDPSVASVFDMRVTAIGSGSAYLVAAVGAVSDSVLVTVEALVEPTPTDDEPEPAPVEEAPAPLTEDRIALEVSQFISLLNDGDTDEVRALFGSAASATENANLLGRMNQRNFAAELVGFGVPSAGENQTTVRFPVKISYRSGFGGSREATGDLAATFTLGPAGWQIESFTVVPGAGF